MMHKMSFFSNSEEFFNLLLTEYNVNKVPKLFCFDEVILLLYFLLEGIFKKLK